MFIDYKFFDDKRRLYQQLELNRSNDSKSNLNKVDDLEQPEIEINPDIIEQSIELMQENESPLDILDEFYPECYPAFPHDFLLCFSQFFQQEGPDCDSLLEKIVFSNEQNAFEIARSPILVPLLLKLPLSFEIILKIMETNSLFTTHFISSGGFFLLTFFSNEPDYLLVIAHIFQLISCLTNCMIDFEQDLRQPSCYNNCFNNEQLSEITYSSFFQNLLFSDNNDVQIICLQSIERFSCVKKLEPILLDKFYNILQNDEYEFLIPFVLQVSYHFDTGIFTREFLNACHLIFQNDIEDALKPALFYISKNMEFICDDEEVSDFIFEDLFSYVENGLFEISRLALFNLIYFMSICRDSFYEQSFDNGIFRFLSNILFTLESAIQEENDFNFIIAKLKDFLIKLDSSDNQFDLSNQNDDLCELMKSLEPFKSYPYDMTQSFAEICISIINRLINTEDYVCNINE